MITAAVWGLGFVFQRQGMVFLPPHLYNAARFLLGGTLLLPLGILQFRHDSSHRTAAPLWVLLLSSVAAGTVLFIASSLQQMGMVYTTSSKAGFITGLYVVLVPIIGWIFRQRITGFVWIGAIFAAAGLYLLCIDGPLQLQHGDMLILACAFVWALHVHVIGHCTRFGTPVLLAAGQFLFCAALALLLSAFTEPWSISALHAGLPAILGNGLLSVFLGFTLQVIAQRNAPPTTAAIIMSFEAVFAALGGFLILHETLSHRMIFGCFLMLTGMILAQFTSPVSDTRL